VVALGESDLGYYEPHMGLARMQGAARSFDALLSVSEENRDYVVDRLGVARDKVAVFPNAADERLFEPRDKAAVRRKLGLPADRPLVVFTGHFIERKGPARVLEALRSHPEVGALFVGKGAQRPEGEQVLFSDRVAHERVADYLSAADAFVLPTQAEGSPNAIVEAMACGLPIISSDIPSVRETVHPDAAVLVDPNDVAALSRAIGSVMGDAERRKAMSRAAREHGSRFGLAERAERILCWLEAIVAERR
jgi:glycosyltransferase involved in cell wall biosynthesis